MKVEDFGNSCVVVTLPKEVMINGGAKELREMLSILLEKDYRTIVLDCGDLAMLDAAGLNVLLVFQRKLQAADGELKISNITNKFIKYLFDKIQIHKVITIEETMCR